MSTGSLINATLGEKSIVETTRFGPEPTYMPLSAILSVSSISSMIFSGSTSTYMNVDATTEVVQSILAWPLANSSMDAIVVSSIKTPPDKGSPS